MLERLLSNKFLQFIILFSLLIFAVTMSFSDARWRQQIRNFTFDNYNLFQPRESTGEVVIVDIDEASLKVAGQWPWPRTVMADVVAKLHDLGAKAIVFDIVFAEEDRTSPEKVAESLSREENLVSLVEQMKELPKNDHVFGKAIKDVGNVVTAFSFTNDYTTASPRLKGIFRGKKLERFVPKLRGVSANLREITKGAAGNGSFFVSTDTDGIIRRVPMLVGHAKPDSSIVSVYPSLSLETIRVVSGERGGRVLLADERYAELDPQRFGVSGIQVGRESPVFIPTNARGEFLVYFSKSQKNWYVSAVDILANTVNAEKVKDKIVMIGTSAVGLKDIRSTPLETFVPGVEVHLNIVEQILSENYLFRSIEAEGSEAFAILISGLIMIVFAPFMGAFAQAVMLMVMIAGAMAAGWYLFTQHGVLIDVTYPVLSTLVIFLLSTMLTYLRSELERRHVREAFGLYISPDFMEELTNNPDKLELGGEIRNLSVMFTDIRRFTSICEGLSPEEIIQLMNDFLTPMSDLVMENRGTIDKYMGDAMMAFWNAPLDDEFHARHACLTALGMQAALDPINKEVKKKAEELGKEPVLLNAGIGINSGPCAVGNMGSKQRFAYSTLGDAVNLSARLESQTKAYGVSILIGESTYKAANELAALELDFIQVKGKTEPTRIFTLLGDKTLAEDKDFMSWKADHDAMMRSYRSANFEEAIGMIEKCKEISKGQLDHFYDMYMERAKDLSRTTLPEGWEGVYIATSK